MKSENFIPEAPEEIAAAFNAYADRMRSYPAAVQADIRHALLPFFEKFGGDNAPRDRATGEKLIPAREVLAAVYAAEANALRAHEAAANAPVRDRRPAYLASFEQACERAVEDDTPPKIVARLFGDLPDGTWNDAVDAVADSIGTISEVHHGRAFRRRFLAQFRRECAAERQKHRSSTIEVHARGVNETLH
ncbi:hypothetical protein GXW78_20200 [Roseomonas terrae]|uniref:Uncharacterized protein n=1 Tax=Neoroseomonas terrae TaxID=424799 RepID=A0ABS5ELW5_9PROT|nr:hypothetical protein [Neoroseomonas terrae]MBR0651998.1 hypothetical protein [Neoroseomonas terrae]